MPPANISRSLLVFTSLWLALSGCSAQDRGPAQVNPRLRGTVAAPEFPEGMDWLNTSRPLTMAELRGKVVLLDFWTYCCINCMHVIPDLKVLEDKYREELVVIGVHSAKFATEKETHNIRQAILRYGIEHPVVNDNQFVLWRAYGARAWPTLVLIDPEGRVVGNHSGEGALAVFDPVLPELISLFDKEGKVDRRPNDFTLEASREPRRILAFPGKVLADPHRPVLYISDSNHNRILVVDRESEAITQVIGAGGVGAADGPFLQATFNHPQGLALADGKLYIADTENHLIRVADLEGGQVTTLIGTGRQAQRFNQPGTGREVALNSPWDLVLVGGRLFAAMAGFHQIWEIDIHTGHGQLFAGSGRENIVDGPRLSAELAQPSGLTTDGVTLYFADSEVSAVRKVPIAGQGSVETMVGTGLFDFGDRIGAGEQARFQHPLGVAWAEGRLYVADTYNNRLKVIDTGDNGVSNFAGDGQPGYTDDPPMFDEPGGLAYADGVLYVADTNNHLVRKVDLETGAVSTMNLRNLQMASAGLAADEVIQLPPIALREDARATLTLELPANMKLLDEAPSVLTESGGGSVPITALSTTLPLVSLDGELANSTLSLSATIYACFTDQTGLCTIRTVQWSVPVADGDGQDHLTLTYRLPTPLGL
ncbi:MAG: thioredoxin-like domain-containing protein [Candidatus Neomarinimicrobiota bacterium]